MSNSRKRLNRREFMPTAVPGYTTFEQLNEDVPAGLNLVLSQEEKKFLDDRKVKLAMEFYCRQCSQCVSSCPKGADIPAMMRTHMYVACYGNFYQARDTYDGISRERGLETCASCDSRGARCVHSISIPKRIDELKALFV